MNETVKQLNIQGIQAYETDKKLAYEYFLKATQIDPTEWHSLNNLSNCLNHQERYEEALKVATQAIKHSNGNSDCYFNAGVILSHLKRFEEAIEMYKKGLKNEKAPYNLACTLLKLGRYKEAWQYYDSRFYLPAQKLMRNRFPQPTWEGQPNKRILIFSEQGLGDLIQFSRFIPLIKGDVTIECPACASEIIKNNFNIKVVETGQQLPEVDYVISICSLPKVLNIELNDISGEPYVKTEDTVDIPNGFNIGISWFGNSTHQEDYRRSCSAEHFIKLSKDLPNIRFWGLQREKSEKWGNIGSSPNLQTLSDTAACINSFDLIITVDTVTAHLAGAVGKPTWVLLPYHSDWRWMLGYDSKWYNSVKLFRQHTDHDWESVFLDIKTLLSSQSHANIVAVNNGSMSK